MNLNFVLILSILYSGTMNAMLVKNLVHTLRGAHNSISVISKPRNFNYFLHNVVQKKFHAQSIEEVRNFLEKGISINEQDEDGNTILHTANAPLIPFLLEKGADLAIKNEKTFFYITAEHNPRTWDFVMTTKGTEHVYYPYAKEFWNLLAAEKKNLGIAYRGHYDHLTCQVYQGLTPAMHAVISGNHDKIELLQKCAPQQIMKEIKALQLIAMRVHFDLHYCRKSASANELNARDADSPRKMYHDLCDFEVKHTANNFVKDLIK